jgi:hypothetical protein
MPLVVAEYLCISKSTLKRIRGQKTEKFDFILLGLNYLHKLPALVILHIKKHAILIGSVEPFQFSPAASVAYEGSYSIFVFFSPNRQNQSRSSSKQRVWIEPNPCCRTKDRICPHDTVAGRHAADRYSTFQPPVFRFPAPY